jgi:predicted RNA binding protein with dsRBD fold (UPF0201 family)
MQSHPRKQEQPRQVLQGQKNMFTTVNVQEPVQEMATAMVKEEQSRVQDVLRSTNITQTARI